MDLGVGQNLLFDHAITNIGSAYNPHLGGFMAPVSGVYVLMSTLLTYLGHDKYFKLVHHGNTVCNMYAHVASANLYNTSSGSFVLYLNKGDVITIQNAQAGDAVHGSDFSYFSGFLLKELEQGPSVVG
ncbi:hypothetical protein DPMN_063925 [Dreissena polymorpha]|uniref:C1q domain-containing protein n=1 Tax=Dreissena polymorpha TaxID=45954 RepID=A0A9D4CBF3_DREPO|nr:hypothetical protein DPMN_063925 [Dreissena polymorpha]